MPKHQLVGEADVEEEQELSCTFDGRVRKKSHFQKQRSECKYYRPFDEGCHDLQRLVPLQCEQGGDQYASEIPPVT